MKMLVEIDTATQAVVPKVPAVSNEMKARFIGEFSWKEETFYYDEDGIEHECEMVRTVPWDLCKRIYKEMASHWIAAAPRPEAGQQADRCSHGVRYPHECRECQDAVTDADASQYIYDQLVEMLEPYVGNLPEDDGSLPGSIIDAVCVLLDFWVAHKDEQQSAPRPVPTSDWISLAEKAPDCLEVRIKLLDGSEINCWAQSDGDFYWKNRSGEHFICESDVTHWQPTGLTRPAAPDGGAV